MSNSIGPLYLLAANTSVAGTGIYTSNSLNCLESVRYSLQVEYGSGASGTFAIQGSLDALLAPATPTWSPIAGLSLTAVTGSAGNQILDVPYTGIPNIRVVYTNTAGTGTMTILGFAKGD